MLSFYNLSSRGRVAHTTGQRQKTWHVGFSFNNFDNSENLGNKINLPAGIDSMLGTQHQCPQNDFEIKADMKKKQYMNGLLTKNTINGPLSRVLSKSKCFVNDKGEKQRRGSYFHPQTDSKSNKRSALDKSRRE